LPKIAENDHVPIGNFVIWRSRAGVTHGEAASEFETFAVDAIGAADIREISEPVVFADAIAAEPPGSGDREGNWSCLTRCEDYAWLLR
jgi:hypothetical protein